jgi:hypothetical protein
MNGFGAAYPPKLIDLIKAVLDEVSATIPEAKKRDPVALRKAALAIQGFFAGKPKSMTAQYA